MDLHQINPILRHKLLRKREAEGERVSVKMYRDLLDQYLSKPNPDEKVVESYHRQIKFHQDLIDHPDSLVTQITCEHLVYWVVQRWYTDRYLYEVFINREGEDHYLIEVSFETEREAGRFIRSHIKRLIDTKLHRQLYL